MVLARRMDAANEALLQLKVMVESGEPAGLIDSTLDKIEGLLGAVAAALFAPAQALPDIPLCKARGRNAPALPRRGRTSGVDRASGRED